MEVATGSAMGITAGDDVTEGLLSLVTGVLVGGGGALDEGVSLMLLRLSNLLESSSKTLLRASNC